MTYKFITLPLARYADESEQQELYENIRRNKELRRVLKTYSDIQDWPEGICFICGSDPNSCNCDNYYNKKSKIYYP